MVRTRKRSRLDAQSSATQVQKGDQPDEASETVKSQVSLETTDPPVPSSHDFMEEYFPSQLQPQRLNELLAECGACLFNICDDDEDKPPVDGAVDAEAAKTLGTSAETSNETSNNTFALLDCCKHVFHSVCIQTWLKREATCPQCRKNFTYVGWYRLNGERQSYFEVTPDMTEEQDSDEDTSSSFTDEESSSPARRLRRRPGQRQTVRRPSRSENNSRRSRVSQRQFSRASDDAPSEIASYESILREQLRRQVELDRRRRISRHVTAEQAKKSIEAALARMPYNSNQLPPVNPRLLTFPIRPPAQRFQSVFKKSGARYDSDFLSSMKA